jgi:hypothetical protein
LIASPGKRRAVRDPKIADLLVANGIEPLASGP